MEAGDVVGALDKIADSFSVIEFARGCQMWDGGQKCSEEERSLGARNAALKLHATTTHLKRDAIIAHWRATISIDKSNELAAELLQAQFPEVAHRTLARYVAGAKKLPPAGTL